MSSDYLQMEQTIKGTGDMIDPRSKLAATLIIIVGVSLSIDPRQVLFFTMLIVPMLLIYQPGFSFVKRVLIFLPFIIIVTVILLLVITDSITLSIFGNKSKTYTPFDFAVLNALRFTTSVMHSTILLESEAKRSELIDALASFYFFKAFAAILILVYRMVERLQTDYNKMISSAISKGSKSLSGIKSLFFRFRILSRLLTRVGIYSEILGDTLTARGFSTKTYTPTIPNWTSEGLTVIFVTLLFAVVIVTVPVWINI